MVRDEITDEQIKQLFKEDIESGKYTVEQIRKEIAEAEKNWPTGRWHFEYIESPRNPNEKIGSAYKKLEKLSKKPKKY